MSCRFDTGSRCGQQQANVPHRTDSGGVHGPNNALTIPERRLLALNRDHGFGTEIAAVIRNGVAALSGLHTEHSRSFIEDNKMFAKLCSLRSFGAFFIPFLWTSPSNQRGWAVFISS
jgi:hypothetical protein